MGNSRLVEMRQRNTLFSQYALQYHPNFIVNKILHLKKEVMYDEIKNNKQAHLYGQPSLKAL